MTILRRIILATRLPMLPLCSTSCSLLISNDGSTPPPHAFIKYTPPPAGDTSLRLAVKDLIDMKGEVTSAGSELLHEQAKIAAKDAACLRIARDRGVTIVGKANLSEFGIVVSGRNAVLPRIRSIANESLVVRRVDRPSPSLLGSPTSLLEQIRPGQFACLLLAAGLLV